MSMTKIMVENCDNGKPRVSVVVFPGQSHISSGMTVLATHHELHPDVMILCTDSYAVFTIFVVGSM